MITFRKQSALTKKSFKKHRFVEVLISRDAFAPHFLHHHMHQKNSNFFLNFFSHFPKFELMHYPFCMEAENV